jgi:hypothetical protein
MVEMLLDVAAESALGALCHSARPTQPLQEALVAAAAHGLAPVIKALVRMRADVRGHKHPVRARVRTSTRARAGGFSASSHRAQC